MADRIKVLLLPLHRWVSTRWGSELSWAFNLARSLGSCPQLEVSAVVGNIDSDDKNRLEEYMRIISLGIGRPDSRTPRTYLTHAAFYWKLFKRGSKLLRDLRPDVAHHVFPMGLGVGQNPVFLTKPRNPPKVIGPILYPTPEKDPKTAILSPAGAPSLGPANAGARLLRRLHESILRRASWLLFDCRETRDLCYKATPSLATVRCTILAPCAYQIPEVHSVSKDPRMIIGVLHYLRRRKRVDALLRALPLMAPSISVIIGGTGPEETNLKNMAQVLKVEERVKFVGAVTSEGVREFWKSIDVAVNLDPMPPLALASIQEAMIHGRPFVASGTPGSGMVDFPYGITLGTNSESLAKIMNALASNPERRLSLSNAARLYAERHFSDIAVRRDLLSVYEHALTEPSEAGHRG